MGNNSEIIFGITTSQNIYKHSTRTTIKQPWQR